MALDWKSAYAAMHRDGEAAFPPAALYYILEVVRNGARENTPSGPHILTPEKMITTFRDKARADFGPLVREVLEEWRLRTPVDLGRAVILLGRYRCLSLAPSDTTEAFAATAAGALPFGEGIES
jgi:uncharacterized repeat protein (TIGR04138 family)